MTPATDRLGLVAGQPFGDLRQVVQDELADTNLGWTAPHCIPTTQCTLGLTECISETVGSDVNAAGDFDMPGTAECRFEYAGQEPSIGLVRRGCGRRGHMRSPCKRQRHYVSAKDPNLPEVSIFSVDPDSAESR